MATAQVYTASNEQGDAWRRQSLREAHDGQTTYTAQLLSVHGALHLFAVPTRDRLGFRFVVWSSVDDDFYCSAHRMHACECSGAALISLTQRGLLPYMTGDEPGEFEANAQVWRAANS
jgi:hypothetical protein